MLHKCQMAWKMKWCSDFKGERSNSLCSVWRKDTLLALPRQHHSDTGLMLVILGIHREICTVDKSIYVLEAAELHIWRIFCFRWFNIVFCSELALCIKLTGMLTPAWLAGWGLQPVLDFLVKNALSLIRQLLSAPFRQNEDLAVSQQK